MASVHDELRTAFEEAGYEVAEASDNRGHVRVSLLAEDPDQSELKEVTTEVVPDEEMIGWSIEPESREGENGVATVITFRQRS